MAFRSLRNFLTKNQTTSQTVAKNASWLLVGEIVSRALKIFIVIYAARSLGVEGWGTFSYILSTVSICCFLADAGLTNLITREYALTTDVTPAKKMIVLVKAFYAMLSFAAILGVSYLVLARQGIAAAGLLLGSFIIIDLVRDFSAGIARGQEQMQADSLSKIVTSGAITVLGFGFLAISPSVTSLALAYMVGAIIGLFSVRSYLFHVCSGLCTSWDRSLFVSTLRSSGLFAIIVFTTTLMYNEDLILVGWMTDFHHAGLYAAAQKLTQFFTIIASIVVLSTIPTLVKKSSNQEQYQEYYSKIWQFLVWLAIPMTTGSILLAGPILEFMFGSSYAAAASAFIPLAASIVFVFPTVLLINSALSQGKQGSLVAINIAANVIHIGLTYIGIKVLGITGAGIATTITLATTYLLMSKRFMAFRIPNAFESLIKIAVGLVGMAAIVVLLKPFALPVIIVAGLAGISYLLVLWILNESRTREYASGVALLIQKSKA